MKVRRLRDWAAKSIAILDEEALLTTLAYVDLNVMAAGMAKTPEESPHTSVKARVDHCRELGILDNVVNQPADRTHRETAAEDEAFWLVPVADERAVAAMKTPSSGLSARVGQSGADATLRVSPDAGEKGLGRELGDGAECSGKAEGADGDLRSLSVARSGDRPQRGASHSGGAPLV